MTIISIDQDTYSQGREKQLRKLSTECIGLLKILRNKMEITTLISKWTCQSQILSRSFWRWYQWVRIDSFSVAELRLLGLKNWAIPFRLTSSWGFENINNRISKEITSLLVAPGSLKTWLGWEMRICLFHISVTRPWKSCCIWLLVN